MNEPTIPLNQPAAASIQRVLLQVGDVNLPEATFNNYDAVVGLGSVAPRHGRTRYQLCLSEDPSDLKQWGSLCVLYFPNAVQFDVCGGAAGQLYFELRALAAYDSGFKVSFLRPTA